jgi:hypothetical protein
LFLRTDAHAKGCNCLRIAAGQPRDPAFEWESVIPDIDPSSQVVVAFSSRGEVCEGEPIESQGASYHGFEKRGADVIVMVESARPGRPLVSGAILPRPDSGGRILVQAVPATLPYGKSKGDSGGVCEVTTEASEPVASTPVDAAALPEPEAETARAFDEDSSLENDPNRPDDDDELDHRRKSLYLGTQLGVAYMRVSPYDKNDFSAFSGPGFDFDLLIGGSPTRDFAVGGMIGGAAAPKPRAAQSDAQIGSKNNMNVVHVGAFADYYFMSDGNLHGMAFLGYERLAFSRAEQLVNGKGNGLGLALGLGYDFWIARRWSAGFLLRGGYAVMSFPSGRGGLLTPLLAGTLTFH